MSVIRIQRRELGRYQSELSALEHLASYPIGTDRFQIDHGSDYFRFFERLGTLYYHASLEQGRIVAVGAGVLRRLPFRQGAEPRKCWYGADVKVHPQHRGRRLPLAMVTRIFLPNFLRCRRGYAVSMNPGDGSPNKVLGVAQSFRWVTIDVSHVLEIFSFDADTMRAAEALVVEHRGPLSYLSLRGIKDIVLASTGQPMPLLHVQFGPCAETGQAAPQPAHTHMFCAPRGDALSTALAARGHRATASATIINHGMSQSDWRFILTSDI